MNRPHASITLLTTTLLVMVLLALPAMAQTGAALQGTEAPSVMNGVDVFSGRLEHILPLMNIQGRGNARQSLFLPLRNLPWKAKQTATLESGDRIYNYYIAELANPLGTHPRGGYASFGRLDVETKYTGWFFMETPTVTEIRFTSNSGAVVHFRDVLTNGQPFESRARGCVHYTIPPPNPPPACSRGKVFRAIDGSNATFVADEDIYDVLISDFSGFPSPYSLYSNISGTLFLSDGTRIRIANNFNQVSKITDRNGNVTTVEYETQSGPTYFFLKKIKDSLNREVRIEYGDSNHTSYFDEIVYKGFGGAERRIRINYTGVGNVMVAGQSLGVALFPDIHTTCQLLSGGGSCDPTPAGGVPGQHYAPAAVVPSSIVLPNGRQYQFFYNNYLEIARVVHPTGSYFDYSYSGTIGASADGVIGPTEIYRRVSSVKSFDDSGQVISEQLFSNIPQYVASSSSYIDNVTVDVKDATAVNVSKTRHFFRDNVQSLHTFLPASYGKQYKSEILDPISGVVLRKTERTWAQRAPFQWCTGTFWTVYTICDDVNNPNSGPPVDPRLTEITTTLETGQVTKKTFNYDQYNNVTDVFEYDFGSGVAGPLLRRTHTDYLTASAYTINSVNLLRLPVTVSILDANNVERARTTYEYDNYSTDANHAGLLPRASISGFDSAFTSLYITRGNATAATQHLLVNGVVNESLTSYAQYDQVGNIIKTIDGRGYSTTHEFTDNFGAPNADVQSNAAPPELSASAQTCYGYATGSTDPLGHTSYVQFDYYTGLPVDSKDTNGIFTSIYSENEPLDRVTKAIEAVNTPAQRQTSVIHDDAARTTTVVKDLRQNLDGVLVTKTILDSVGREVEKRTYEGGTNYIATRQEYDSLGRVRRVSNPYRPWQEDSLLWTQFTYDALGRQLLVTRPDSSVTQSAYSGNLILTTDQEGRQRITKTSAVGNLVNVWEITAPDSDTVPISFSGHPEVTAGYFTSYEYGALNELTEAIQGSQVRTFGYDSLNRLVSENNPESGTTAYQYDAVGNLVVKTDSRGVSTHISYDAGDRPIRRWHNASASLSATTHNTPALPASVSLTPETNFFYDSQTLPSGAPVYARGSSIGRLVAVIYGSGSSSGDYYALDVLGRITLKIQQIGGVDYQVHVNYNVSDQVTSQVYPSGHSITYNYDQAGRLADRDSQQLAFSGNLGGGAPRNYSTGILYSPFGQLVKERLETTTPIYNKRFHNSRGQLAEIRVSTSYTGPADTTWNRGAIINHFSTSCAGACGGSNSTTSMTDNSGNLKKQELYVPADEQVMSYTTWWQQYSYDNLNRLKWVREVSSGTEVWRQTYNYDRFGNRTIDAGATSGGVNNKQFTVSVTNNRLGVPAGGSGTMAYDLAGNLTTDTYSGGAVNRAYDALNRMTSETQQGSYVAGSYTYDSGGHRVRRRVNGIETWQIFGLGDELLAEYPENGPATTPSKEYGYRNGQLLIVAGSTAPPAAGPSGLTAAPSAGGASITLGWAAYTGATNYRIERKSPGGNYSSIGTSTSNNFTDSTVTSGLAYLYRVCKANGAGVCTTETSNIALATAVAFTDPTVITAAEDPTGLTATTIKAVHITQLRSAVNAVRGLAGLSNATWTNPSLAPGVSLVAAIDFIELREKLDEALTALALSTSSYTDPSLGTPSNRSLIKRIHLTELRQRATSGSGTQPGGGGEATNYVKWLVADQLGTPRIILDETGSLASITRHDYLPFGEELGINQGARTTAMGYGADNVRQKFTGYESDDETGLNFAEARYHSSIQGRFTGPDPLLTSVDISLPQSWNRYAYCLNNPLLYIDPSGMDPDYIWITNGAGYYQQLTLEEFDLFFADEQNILNWYPLPSGSIIPKESTQAFWGNVSAEFREENSQFIGYDVRIRADGRLEYANSMAYDGFPREMSRYVEAHTTVMTIEFTIMSFFLLPASAGGTITTLGLTTGTQAAARTAMVPTAAVSLTKVDEAAGLIDDFVGKGATATREGGSDLIVTSADKTRQVRFDLVRSHGNKPHINVETWKPRNLYPGDKRMIRTSNEHIYPKP